MLALAFFVQGAHAVHKCTDTKTGKVTYSDAPCPTDAARAGVRITANVVEGQPAGDATLRANAVRASRVQSMVQAGQLAVGMTESEVFAVLGEPTVVNTDAYAGNRLRKQMVFDRGQNGTQYVYTEGGVVTAIQVRPGYPRAAPAERCHTDLEIRNAGVSMNSQRLTEAERLAIRRQVAQMKPC